MTHWEPSIEALLDASRGLQPPKNAKALVRKRLATSIALTATGSVVVAKSTPYIGAKLVAAVKAGCSLIPGTAAATAVSIPALMLGPVVVGVALGLSALAPTSVDVPARHVTERATSPGARAPAGPTPPRAVAPETKQAEAKANVTEPLPPRQVTPPASHFAAESALIERARVVLRQGDAELALRALADYRRLYPTGMFFVEALTLEAQALCSEGRLEEGQGRLRRLEASGTPVAALQNAKRQCAAKNAGNQEAP